MKCLIVTIVCVVLSSIDKQVCVLILIIDNSRDTVAVSILNSLASILAGFAVFGFLGFMALKMDTTVDQVATPVKEELHTKHSHSP